MKVIIELFNKYKSVILYLIFGVLTTLVNILSYAFFTKVINVEYLISNIISWIISVTFAFITNKVFVFESKSREKKIVLKELLLFYYYRLLSLGIEMILLYVFVDLFNVNDLIMKVVTNIVVIILNYFFSKFKIFKGNNK